MDFHLQSLIISSVKNHGIKKKNYYYYLKLGTIIDGNKFSLISSVSVVAGGEDREAKEQVFETGTSVPVRIRAPSGSVLGVPERKPVVGQDPRRRRVR